MLDDEEFIHVVLDEPLPREVEELKKILYTDLESQLPFELPDLVVWPRGHGSLSERALLLMRAGARYLKINHPVVIDENSIVPTAKTHEQSSEAIEVGESTDEEEDAAKVKPIQTTLGLASSARKNDVRLTSSAPKQVEPSQEQLDRPVKDSPDFDISLFQ